MTVNVADDTNGYLGIQKSGSPNDQFATLNANGNGEIGLDFSNSGNGGSGVGLDSVYNFDNVLTVTNQGTQTIYVWATFSGSSFPHDGSDFWLYPNGSSSQKLRDSSDQVLGLSPGQSANIGIHIDTNALSSTGTETPTMTLRADVTKPTSSNSVDSTGGEFQTIEDWNDLDNIRNNLGGTYVLLNDLDSTTAGYSSVGADDGTFSPIGTFGGTLDGQGYTISDLNIDASSKFAGLFSAIAGTVENLTFENADVTSSETFLGVLAGNFGGTVQNVTVSNSSVSALGYAGGLVGVLNKGTIQDASVSGSWTVESDPDDSSSPDIAGGIAGASVGGTIENSETSITVKGNRQVGGIVGFLQRGTTTITGSAATGRVEGTSYGNRANGQNIGGLIGAANATEAGNPAGIIEESYTTATIKGTENVGGLLGDDTNGPAPITIKRSYSTADIESTGDFAQKNIGGLVGKGAPDIDNSYAAPTITTDADNNGTSAGNVGGVIGAVNSQSDTDGTDTYWDTAATGYSSPVGSGSLNATGLTTTQMQGSSATSNMSGLDFTTEWQTQTSPDDYPTLQ